MLHNDPKQDRYCRFTYNPKTGKQEREWLHYADGTFEPVRRNGQLSRKWNDRRTDFQWRAVRKPADWRPWDDGAPLSWNHTLGEGHKPDNWGNKTDHEIKAGPKPFYMGLELRDDYRITRRTERIDGRRERWDFGYDDEGRLISCTSDTGWSQEFEYDAQGRRLRDFSQGRSPLSRQFTYGEDNRLLTAGAVTYEHDENGFRVQKQDGNSITRYAYSPDCRLLGATMPDDRAIRYGHDEHGMRRIKTVDGQVVEAYEWQDLIRLKRFVDRNNQWELHYDKCDRLPWSATINGDRYKLYYDQSGSLKAIVDTTGNVVKAIQYTPFGEILWDSEPGLRVPLGFGGGLYDPDVQFVRFGWRDYDPATGRWTALDPMGDAGGDDDWYGYCLDDPVNGIDPLGLVFSGMGFTSRDDVGGRSLITAMEARGENGVDKSKASSTYDPNSVIGRIQSWAKQYDFRTPGYDKPGDNSLYSRSEDKKKEDEAKAAAEARADRRAQEKADREATQEAEDKAEKERMSTMAAQREEEKQRNIDRYNSYMEEKEKAHDDKLGDFDEPLGGPKETLGAPMNETESQPQKTENVDVEPTKTEMTKAKGSTKGGLVNPEAKAVFAAREKAIKNHATQMAEAEEAAKSKRDSYQNARDMEAIAPGLENYYSGPPDISFMEGLGKLGKGIAKTVTNKDFMTALGVTLSAGAIAPVVATSLPAIGTTGTGLTMGAGAYGTMKAAEGIADAITPGPPSTPIGSFVSIVEEITDRISHK